MTTATTNLVILRASSVPDSVIPSLYSLARVAAESGVRRGVEGRELRYMSSRSSSVSGYGERLSLLVDGGISSQV